MIPNTRTSFERKGDTISRQRNVVKQTKTIMPTILSLVIP